MKNNKRNHGLLALALLIALAGCDFSSPAGTEPSPPAQTPAPGKTAAVTPQSLIQQATTALAAGKLETAEQLSRQVLVGDPGNLDAGLLQVGIAMRRSKQQDAVELLLQLAQAHPQKAPLLKAQAAELLSQSGQVDRAIELLQSVVTAKPDQHEIRRVLAEMLNSRGFRFDGNEHLRYLAGRITLTPRELIGLVNPMYTWVDFAAKPDINDQALIERAGTLNAVAALRSKGDVRDALKLLDGSDLLRDRHPAAVAMRGWLLSSNQDFAALQDWALNAVDSSKRYPAYWLGLGNLFLHHQNPVAATCFVEALRREPNCMEAADGLAQAIAAQDNAQQSAVLLERQQLISEAQSLAYQIGSTDHPSPAMGSEMGRVMNSLGRPIESLAWQESLFARVAPGAPQLTVLRKAKQQLLSKFPSGRNESVIVCGMDAQSLPSVPDALAWLDAKLQPGDAGPSLPPAMKSQPVSPASAPVFSDVAKSVGIEFRHVNATEPIEKEFRLFEPLGSGVVCFDFDCDGRVDLYLGQAGGQPPDQLSQVSNRLMRGQGERFDDVSTLSHSQDFGYTHGVTSGDWNQDGFPDLLIGNVGINRLMINQGDGTFRNATIDSGELPASWGRAMLTFSVAMADVSGDALPDIFETNYVDDIKVFDPIRYDSNGKPIVLPGPKHFQAAIDRLYRSQGNGSAVLESLGESQSAASTGLGVLITDIDGDRQNEIFVANDQNANQLWKRNADSDSLHWTDVALARGCAYGTGGKPFACMGIAAADYDGNGKIDLHVTNFSDECSNLYLQNDSGGFVDQAIAMRLDTATVPMVAFGTQAFDYDNNSSIDLVIGNGHIEDFQFKGKPFRMPTQILARQQSGFVSMDVQGDESYWNQTHLARGVAILDWNRDGRVDVAVTELNDDFVLLENRTASSGHFLQLETVGTHSERDAIGTTVIVDAGGRRRVAVVQTGDGYLCKNESVLFFGLGDLTAIDQVTVQWPSGQTQSFANLAVDRRVLLVEGQSDVWQR
ncbi:FG-GAP-like repeat-containing protein [Stieleria sp. TO1_6]|uniref:FG-GAP-like repeat-containing protein n=1 Tax=Stieleria tagensis TaxID=2956795 RepID=UPI00209B3B89|nr:FG-GAP-like repeat-containing protein [Stieleria tagensis]MCO8124680.1 FG-GAP-like repeat-containing protein [Stieleria tagensis]